VQAGVGVDSDGDVVDGHAATPHVVKEGDCCRQWGAPLPRASEQDA
jgi:hypothetical protein